MNFWKWFFRGLHGRPGCTRFINVWLLVHVAVGVGLSIVVPLSTRDAANSVLLPLAGILVGLTFAWGANAASLLQADEIEQLASEHPGGFEEYLFVFQSAMLCILATLVAWGIAGLGVVDHLLPVESHGRSNIVARAALYCLSSVTLRECWHVVLGAQSLVQAKRAIRLAMVQSGDAAKPGKTQRVGEKHLEAASKEIAD